MHAFTDPGGDRPPGPLVPAEGLPAHGQGRGRDHHQLREPAARGRCATSTSTRPSCGSSPRRSTTTSSARGTPTRRGRTSRSATASRAVRALRVVAVALQELRRACCARSPGREVRARRPAARRRRARPGRRLRRRAAGPGRASSASPTTSCGSAACRSRRRCTFYRAADVFAYPSFNETFGLPILEAMAAGARSSPPTAARCRRPPAAPPLLADPRRPESIADALVKACGPEADAAARARAWSGRRSSPGPRPPKRDARGLPRGPRGAAEGAAMRVLVTGGAGFIGSHTCDRLVELGPRGRRARRAHGAGAPGRPTRLPDARASSSTSATCATGSCSRTCCAAWMPSTTSPPTRTTCPTSPGSPTSTSSRRR